MREIPFLHIANDEKFIDHAIKLFEEVIPNKNIYLINGETRQSLKSVKSHNLGIMVYPYFSNNYWKVIKETKPDVIFIHGLSNKHKILLDKIGNKYKCFLNSWGKDIYNTDKLKEKLYKKDTKRLLDKIRYKQHSFIYRLKQNLFKIFKQKKVRGAEQYLKYIDYMSTVIKEDFELLQTAYPNETSHIKYIQFNYGGAIMNNTESNTMGNNIIIGNNANYSNNHIESFKLLKDIDIGNRFVYVPLSYGGNSLYISEILKKGKYYLGNNFKPLLSFMPFSEYNKILSSIGFAIMNHSRQQAMGNILNLLVKGAKIYMDPQNTATIYLLRLGINVEDINNINSNFFCPLNGETKTNNINIINKHFSFNSLITQTRELVEEVIEK